MLHSLFRLLQLKVENWWAIARVASLFVWLRSKERPGDDEERDFRFWPRETWSFKTAWKRLLLLAAKLLGGLSLGLRIHDRRSRGHAVTVGIFFKVSYVFLADREASVTLSCGTLIISSTNRSSSQKIPFSLKKFPQADSPWVPIGLFTHFK